MDKERGFFMHRDFYTRLINREHPLPESFVPEHLIDIGLPFEAAPGDPAAGMSDRQSRLPAFSRLPPMWPESVGSFRIPLFQAATGTFYRKPFCGKARNK